MRILSHSYEDEKLPPLVAEIYWMHNLLIHHIEKETIVESTH